MPTRVFPVPTRLAVATLLLAATPGCDDLPTPPNQPPDTKLVAEGGPGGAVRLSWSGTDPDGSVEHWEIARDLGP